MFLSIAIGAYLALVAMSVFAVVERKHAESRHAELLAHISELEVRHVALVRSIDLDRAHALGFRDVAAPRHVSIGQTDSNLAFAGTGR